MPAPTIDQLRHALQLSEQIAALKVDLASFFGGTVDVPALVITTPIATAKRKGTRSPEVRARMAAAQQARWAKKKESVTAASPVKSAPVAKAKKKGAMSAEGRAKIVAAQKKRWAAVKAAKSTPAPAKAAPVAKKKKRTLSPEARATIVAAVKARWARAKKGK